MTPSGRIYYINHLTQTTTWEKPRYVEQKATPAAGTDPVEQVSAPIMLPFFLAVSGYFCCCVQDPELPPGWEARKNKDGRTYYVDHFRKITTWEHPNMATKKAGNEEELGPLPVRGGRRGGKGMRGEEEGEGEGRKERREGRRGGSVCVYIL